MPKFRKKPVIVEASQWFKNGDHPDDDVPTDNENIEGKVVRRSGMVGVDLCNYCGIAFNKHGWLDEWDGGQNVCPGDWIVTSVKGECYVRGERYVCKPDIFAAIYEKVEE